MGRDVFQKVGISLQQRTNPSPGNSINSITALETEKNIKNVYLKNITTYALDMESQKVK